MIRFAHILKRIQDKSEEKVVTIDEKAGGKRLQVLLKDIPSRLNLERNNQREKLSDLLTKIQFPPEEPKSSLEEDIQLTYGDSTLLEDGQEEIGPEEIEEVKEHIKPEEIEEVKEHIKPEEIQKIKVTPSYTKEQPSEEAEYGVEKGERKETSQVVKNLEEDLHILLKEGPSSELLESPNIPEKEENDQSSEDRNVWEEEMDEFTKGIFDEDTHKPVEDIKTKSPIPSKPQEQEKNRKIDDFYSIDGEREMEFDSSASKDFAEMFSHPVSSDTMENLDEEKLEEASQEEPIEEETPDGFWEDDFNDDELKLDNVLKEILGKDKETKKLKVSSQDRKRSSKSDNKVSRRKRNKKEKEESEESSSQHLDTPTSTHKSGDTHKVGDTHKLGGDTHKSGDTHKVGDTHKLGGDTHKLGGDTHKSGDTHKVGDTHKSGEEHPAENPPKKKRRLKWW